MSKLCLDCCIAEATPRSKGGARCPACERGRNRRRNARPERAVYRDPAYRAMTPGGPCVDCGSYRDLTRDHVTPIARGGDNSPANIATRCRGCNSRKGAT